MKTKMIKISLQWRKPIRAIQMKRKFYRYQKIGWRKSEIRVCLKEKIKYILMKISTRLLMNNTLSFNIWKLTKTIWMLIEILARICKRTNNLMKNMKKIEGNKRGARLQIKKISLRVSLFHKNQRGSRKVRQLN